MRIIIIGGGIGGLATAIAMTQAGFSVTVYERAKQLIDLGAGITLAPNATRVLYHLGLGSALEEISVTPPHMEFRHYHTGAVIKRMMTQNYLELYGAPYMRLHRWDMQYTMIQRLELLSPGALKLGYNVERLSFNGEKVSIQFSDRSSDHADLVIAADGIRSSIRESLFNPAPPEFTGFVAWRGLVSTTDIPKHLHESVISFGQGRHINRYLVRRGELLNFIAVAQCDKWQDEGWTIPASLDEFLEEFSSFDEGTRTVISRPVLGQLFKWGLFGRPWLDNWSQGRVVLLGDAAHPMLPFLGQGAANALEDAMILTRCLSQESSYERAFSLYQKTRSPRVKKITDETARRGDRYVGEPTAESLKSDDVGEQYNYDAVSGPLG
jgi:salicylate hydroxylase